MSVKIMDCVELTVEKECYAKDGVHKRMQGWICDPRTSIGHGWWTSRNAERKAILQ